MLASNTVHVVRTGENHKGNCILRFGRITNLTDISYKNPKFDPYDKALF